MRRLDRQIGQHYCAVYCTYSHLYVLWLLWLYKLIVVRVGAKKLIAIKNG